MCITHTCVSLFFLVQIFVNGVVFCSVLVVCERSKCCIQQYQQQKKNIAIIIVNLLANYGHKYCHIYLNKLANDDFTTISSWELPIHHSYNVPRLFRREHISDRIEGRISHRIETGGGRHFYLMLVYLAHQFTLKSSLKNAQYSMPIWILVVFE